MKWLTLVLLITCATSTSTAQDAPVVYSVEGNVKYSPKPRGWFNYSPLKTGMPLREEGRLKLRAGATVRLLYDEQFGAFSERGKYNVSGLLQDYDQFRESEYAELLEERVKEAEAPFFFYLEDEPGFAASTPPSKPKYESKEGDGHGDTDSALLPITTNGGKVAGDRFFVSWAPKSGQDAPSQYVFLLTNSQGEVLLDKATAEGNLTVEASDAGLATGQFYRWQARASDDAAVSTPLVAFEYVEEAAVNTVLADLKEEPAYQAADPAAQLLLEAVALEKSGFQERAGLRFREATERDPGHDLARALYKAFLWRQGL